MEHLAIELAEIFQEGGFSKKDILRLMEEERPDFPEDYAEDVAKSVLRLINAVNFLKRRFPRGRLPKKIHALSGVPFDPVTLSYAARQLNGRKGRKSNVVVFPKIPKVMRRQLCVSRVCLKRDHENALINTRSRSSISPDLHKSCIRVA